MEFIFTSNADKSFKKLQKQDQNRIFKKLLEISKDDKPLRFLVPYANDMVGLYKLRVGKYRVVNFIIEDDNIAYIVAVEGRDKSYSKKSKDNIKTAVDNLKK